MVASDCLCPDVSLYASDLVPAGGGFRFSCGSGSGAVLVLGDALHGEDLMQGRLIKEYVRSHAESWYVFARTLGLDDELGNQDLLLVTGRSTTSQWGVAAFTQKRKEAGIEFHLGFAGSGAHVGLSCGWAHANAVEHRSGLWRPPTVGSSSTASPALPSAPTSSNTAGTPLSLPNHSVFLRGLYVHPRPFKAVKIKAAAQPGAYAQSNSDDQSTGAGTSAMDISTYDSECSLSDASSVTDYSSDSDLDEAHVSVWHLNYSMLRAASAHGQIRNEHPRVPSLTTS